MWPSYNAQPLPLIQSRTFICVYFLYVNRWHLQQKENEHCGIIRAEEMVTVIRPESEPICRTAALNKAE